jgi:hypothetical protein
LNGRRDGTHKELGKATPFRLLNKARALIHGPIHVLLNGGHDLGLMNRIKAAKFSGNAQSRIIYWKRLFYLIVDFLSPNKELFPF